jgi:hypothetical protein
MKRFIAVSLLSLSALVSGPAHAVLVAGIEFADNALADQASGSGSFLNWDPAYDNTGINPAQLSHDMTDDSAATYVFGTSEGAYIDLSFNNVSVYDGDGADLAVFFVGSGGHTGDLTLLDASGGSIAFGALQYTGFAVEELFDYGNDGVVDYSPIYVGYFDLADVALAPGAGVQNFRLNIGDGGAVPSLMAAINTTPTSPVPIPGSVMLLMSGLAALGMISRRRSRS